MSVQGQRADWEVIRRVMRISADLIDGTGIDLRDLREASDLLRGTAGEIEGRKLGGLHDGVAALFGIEPSQLLMNCRQDDAEDRAIRRYDRRRRRAA
jgi:hypothetical protein